MRAARVWYRYANEVIPPPSREQGPTDMAYRDPERKRRVPKKPMLIIFRQGPPRAQTYIAENLAEEGWIYRSPWTVDAADSDRPWFKGDFRIVPSANSQEEWEIAYSQWKEHQVENGFLLDDTPEKFEMMELAKRYAQSRGVPVGNDVPPPTAEEQRDPEIMRSYKACVNLRFNGSNMMVTNVQSFLFQSEIEKDPETIKARKLLYEADQAKKSGKQAKAIRLYAEVLGSQDKPGLWGKLLKTRGRFLTYERTAERVLEETFEHQVRYLRLLSEDKKPELQKCTLLLFDVASSATPAAVSPFYLLTGDLILRQIAADKFAKTEALPMPGPFDGYKDDGKPWVPEHIKMRVLRNMGMIKPAPKQQGPPQGGPPGGPAGT